MSERDTGSMCNLIARLDAVQINSDMFEVLDLCQEAAELIESLEAQLSALRDQQPVARKPTQEMLEAGYAFVDDDIAGRISLIDIWKAMWDASCVSPDQPEKQNTGDTSGVASDQSKRGVDSHESADHPVE